MCCGQEHAVRINLFESHVGLRRGENLSLLLFALFLNDMETFFTGQKWNTLKFIDKLNTDSRDEVSCMQMVRLQLLKMSMTCRGILTY